MSVSVVFVIVAGVAAIVWVNWYFFLARGPADRPTARPVQPARGSLRAED